MIISWLKNTLIKNKPPTTIKKVAIIIGHGNGDSGAIGWNGMSEFNYNSFVAEEVIKAVKTKEVKLFYRGNTGISGVSSKVNLWQPDLSIELHLNAYNEKAKGCEVLCVKSNSEGIAENFAKAFTDRFKRVLRGEEGVKRIGPLDRGYGNLKDFSFYAILLEPFFIDNKEEWLETNEYIKFLISWIEGI